MTIHIGSRRPRNNSKSLPLAKVGFRTFLQDGDRLSAGSFVHNVNLLRWEFEGVEDTKVWEHTEMKLFFGGKIIKLHSCDLSHAHYGLTDFVRKLDVILNIVGRAIKFLEGNPGYQERFVEKSFLNPLNGHVDLYTSTIAITVTPTHGITFEISSCDFKSRITLSRKFALKFFIKLSGFVQKAKDAVQHTLNTQQEHIYENMEC